MRPPALVATLRSALARGRSDWLPAVAAAALVGLLHLGTGLVARLDLAWADHAATSGTRAASRDIAVVAIDDASLERIGPWPWSRDKIARLVDRLGVAGARSIVLALDLSSPPDSPELAGAIARNARTLMALQPEADGGKAPLPALAAGAIAVGHVDWQVDSDGLARRLVLTPQRDGFGVPSLALLAAVRQRDLANAGTPAIDGDRLTLGDIRMRIDQEGALRPRWIDDSAGSPFVHEPAHALLGGTASAARYAGRVVLVGLTAPGAASLLDTPARARMPRVEALAQTVSALLTGQTVLRPWWADAITALCVLAALLAVLFALPRLEPMSAWVLVGVAAVLLPAAAHVTLSLTGVWVPSVWPVLTLLAAHATLSIVRARRAAAARAAAPAARPDFVPTASGVPSALRAGPPSVLPSQAAASEPPTGPMIGRFLLTREVGRGPTGTVYFARDPNGGKTVAIKTMALAQDFAGPALAEARARFMNAAQAAIALHHPDIVVTHEAGEAQGLVYLVTDAVLGEDLQRYTRAGQAMPLLACLRIVARAARALAHAHSLGIFHRGIKPSNVMVDATSNRVMLIDFGTSDGAVTAGLRSESLGATRPYAAPEQRAGRPGDARSDLYALGVLLFHLLTARLPEDAEPAAAPAAAEAASHGGATAQAKAGKGTKRRARGVRSALTPGDQAVAARPDLPPALAAFLDKALATDPRRRHGDGLQFADELQAIAMLLGAPAWSRPAPLDGA